MTQDEMRQKIEKALHIDWAFKDVNWKPDKVTIEYYPKGGYHLSYSEFIKNIQNLLVLERKQFVEEALSLLDKAELEKWFDMPDTTENWKTWKRIRNTINSLESGGGND